MATDGSHRVIMGGKGVITFSQLFLIGSFLYLQVTVTYIRACMSSKFGQIRPRTTELAALERRKKILFTDNGENYVITFSRLFFFLIGSFSYLQVIRTCIKAWMSLNLGQIPPLTIELAALQRLKIDVTTFSPLLLIRTFSNLQVMRACIMDEFEFWPDLTTDYGVSCPWASEKNPIDL